MIKSVECQLPLLPPPYDIFITVFNKLVPFYCQEAEALGKKDEERLLHTRRLSLVVDLDQTLIHTTMELIPEDMEV